MQIRKAVVPVAGFGTRFLPATKNIPKGMIPVVDKPIIQYIVEELVRSGIEQIVLITSTSSKALEDFFDTSFELEHALEKSGKWKLLEDIQRITNMADIMYVRQRQPLGNGHAVLMAQHIVGNEPFVMLWGDDILLGDPPIPSQLIQVAQQYNGPVVGVRRVTPDYYEKYGMLEVEPITDRVSRALSVIEKPKREESPSDLAQIGGFVLTPDIFQLLENTTTGTGGEIYLADALVKLMQQRPVYSYEFTGTRYDAGSKPDYLRATVELALADPILGPDFRKFLQTLDLDGSTKGQ